MTTHTHHHDHDHHHHDHDHDHEHHHHDEPSQVKSWLQVAVLLGLGLYFAYNIVSANLVNYINERFAWLSYLAAGIFLVLGGFNAWLLIKQRRDGHHHDAACDCGHDHDHDHGHSHGAMSWMALFVVTIPLLLGTLVPSRPLGAAAIDGSVSLNIGSASTANLTTFSISPLNRNVLDWLRVFNHVQSYDEIKGQPADVIGFVYREPTFTDDQFMVARFTISCCVADASAIGVPVSWSDTESLPIDTWVRVQGTFDVTDFRGDRAPVLIASDIEIVEQPSHPYLYP